MKKLVFILILINFINFNKANGQCVKPIVTFITPASNKCTRDSIMFKVMATGTAPLSYQWFKKVSNISNATKSSYIKGLITPLDSGIYCCHVSNICGDTIVCTKLTLNNCIPNICNMKVNASVSNATCDTCHNGSATVNATNGSAPYTWTWYTSPLQTTQTVSGLAYGTYTVCVTDTKGCTACNDSVYVGTLNCSLFHLSVSTSNASCNTCADGYAWVNPNIWGGTNSFSCKWYTNPIQTTDTAKGLIPGTYYVCIDSSGCTACDSITINKCKLQLSTSITNASCDSCHNGSATANSINGFAPYTWTWFTSPIQTTQTAKGLSPGAYKVCITDSIGCQACNNSVLINSPCNGFHISVSSSNASCNTCVDGYAWVNPNIWKEPNSFSCTWYTNPIQTTDTAKWLVPGTYYVCIDSSGCTACDSITINKCKLQISTSITNASCDTCHNGSATANAINGIAPYKWTWYTSPIQTTQTATGLKPGAYSVCITDSIGCQACNNSVLINSPCNGFHISVNSSNASCNTCADGYAWVNPNIWGGTNSFTCTWYTNPIQTTDTARGLKPGTYYVCIDSSGCTACDSVIVRAPDCSAYFDIYPTSTPHVYDVVNRASGVEPIKYLWSWGDGRYDSIAYPVHAYDTTGFYKICLTITDVDSCKSTHCDSYFLMKSDNPMVKVNVITPEAYGINEIKADESFYIYPNPASDNLTIVSKTKATESYVISIFNIQGQEVFSKKIILSATNNINISSLSNGVYIITLQNVKENYVKKIVIQR